MMRNWPNGLPPLRRMLDPRPSGQAAAQPFADSVNIPFDELAARIHELGPRGRPVVVAEAGQAAAAACAVLRDRGRDLVVERPELGDGAPGRLWTYSPALELVCRATQPGRALDIACGTGRNAIALAAAGWTVVAIDHLPDALDRARDLERRYLGRSCPRVEWNCQDARSVDDLDSFDLALMLRFSLLDVFLRVAREMGPGASLVVEPVPGETRGPSLQDLIHAAPELSLVSPGETRFAHFTKLARVPD